MATRLLALLLVATLAGCSAAPEGEAPATATPSLPGLVEELATLRAEAYEAYEESDRPALLEVLSRGRALQPTSPFWTYNLAAAHAAKGDTDEALKWASRTLELGADYAFERDPDFASLVESEALAPLEGRREALRRPLMRASEAFSLGRHDLIAEALAYDAPRERFLVSSARQRSIFAVEMSGPAQGRVRVFVPRASEGLGAVLGLALDASRGWLWACSASIPEMVVDESEPPVEPAVYRFDLRSGRVLSRHALPPAEGRRTPNDALVLGDGSLLVSDSSQGAIYKVRAEAPLAETLVAPGTLRSPQGIAPAPRGNLVVVADYSLGLVSLDPETGATTLLDTPEAPTLVGIDGLSAHDLGFVAVQNGIRPARVIRIEVSGDLTRIESVETLERAHPDFDEPTTGQVVGKSFYFVANSHWGGVDEAGRLRQGLSDHLVMRLPLEP